MGSIFTLASSWVSSRRPRAISFCIRHITFFKSASCSWKSARICSACGGGGESSWGGGESSWEGEGSWGREGSWRG